MKTIQSFLSPVWRFTVGILIILLLSLLLFYIYMHPPMNEVSLMALFLSGTALFSGVVGFLFYRLGWLDQSPTISWTLSGGYVIASMLIFVNVWITAKLMFVDQHDLQLATVLLLFASGIAVVWGIFFSNALTSRIHHLKETARAITQGNFDARTQVAGRDELADLARAFDEMADRLQKTSRQQKELDQLRRELIAWVSHDLQTPLASIRAIIEALRDGIVEDGATTMRYLQTAGKEVQSLSLLIDDLFSMAQIDAGGLQVNLGTDSITDLVSDTLVSFTELAQRKGVTLSGNVNSDVDPVWMDARLIGRALSNLVSNSLRHTPPGGRVELLATLTSQGILIEVFDTGEGIHPQDIPHVFDRFYRSEKSRSRTTGGAGLGLAITRGIVEAHGARLSVESQPGKFTRFCFTLPLSEKSVKEIL